MGGKRINLNRKCSIKGCLRIHKARGYCDLHWQRWNTGIDLNAPKYFNRLVKKGWIVGGYKWISTPDRGEIMEHRYLMEKWLGRRLGVDEIVHHKNHDKLDNRMSNLELMTRSEHTSHHRRKGAPHA